MIFFLSLPSILIHVTPIKEVWGTVVTRTGRHRQKTIINCHKFHKFQPFLSLPQTHFFFLHLSNKYDKILLLTQKYENLVAKVYIHFKTKTNIADVNLIFTSSLVTYHQNSIKMYLCSHISSATTSFSCSL